MNGATTTRKVTCRPAAADHVLRRLLAAVVGIALAVGIAFGLAPFVPHGFAVAVSVGIGAGAFLVLDGSAGTGEGWLYREARPPVQQLRDFGWTAGGGIALGLALAGVAMVVELGELGASILVAVGTLFAANVVFLYRRPEYEDALEE